MKNYRLFIIILTVLASATFTSCKQEEQEIRPVIVKIPEAEKSFIEKLSQYYYGKTIYFKKESDRIAGASGTVEYSLLQQDSQMGTHNVTVEFRIKSATAGFQTLNYTVNVDMVSMGSKVVKADMDGKNLSEMNLILMLGNW
jgi:hypothetical protein